MESRPNSPSKADIKALERLKTECLFIIIPFFLLIAVKGYNREWMSILLAPEWSLASSIIVGQLLASMTSGTASSKFNAGSEAVGWYVAKRLFLIILTLTCYFGMLSKPTWYLGVTQLCVFFFTIWLHFRDGMVAKKIEHINS